jgi:hypothetical protein
MIVQFVTVLLLISRPSPTVLVALAILGQGLGSVLIQNKGLGLKFSRPRRQDLDRDQSEKCVDCL